MTSTTTAPHTHPTPQFYAGRYDHGRFVVEDAETERQNGREVLIVPTDIMRFGPLPYRHDDGNVYWELKAPEDFATDRFLSSLNGRPVTENHPGLITEQNLSDYTCGQLFDEHEVFDDRIRAIMSIYQPELIRKVYDGKAEVSTGLWNGLIREEGVYDGVPYDFRQVVPRLNHLAIVEKGRCGEMCRAHLDNGDAHAVPDLRGIQDAAATSLDVDRALDRLDRADLRNRLRRALPSPEPQTASLLSKDASEWSRDDCSAAVRALAIARSADSFAAGRAEGRRGFDPDLAKGGQAMGDSLDEALSQIRPSRLGRADRYFRVMRWDAEVLGVHLLDEEVGPIFVNVEPIQAFDANTFEVIHLDRESVKIAGVDLFIPMLDGVQAIVGTPINALSNPIELQTQNQVSGEAGATRTVQSFVFHVLDGWDVERAEAWFNAKFGSTDATVDSFTMDGVVPPNPSSYELDEESSWAAPDLPRPLEDMTDQQKREFVRLFAWMASSNLDEITNAGADLALPHHFEDGTLSLQGLFAAAARRNQADIPEADRDAVTRHLGDHYREFDRVPPWEREDDWIYEDERDVFDRCDVLTGDERTVSVDEPTEGGGARPNDTGRSRPQQRPDSFGPRRNPMTDYVIQTGETQLDLTDLVEAAQDSLSQERLDELRNGLSTVKATIESADASGNAADSGDASTGGSADPVDSGELKDQIATNRQRIDELETKRRDLQSKIDKTKDRLTALTGDDDPDQTLVTVLENQCDQLETKLDEADSELTEKKAELDRLQGQLESTQDENQLLRDRVEELETNALTHDDLAEHAATIGEIKSIFPQWDWNGESVREMKTMVIQETEGLLGKSEDKCIDPETVTDERLDGQYRATIEWLKTLSQNAGTSSTSAGSGSTGPHRSMAVPRNDHRSAQDEDQARLDELRRKRKRVWVGYDDEEDREE